MPCSIPSANKQCVVEENARTAEWRRGRKIHNKHVQNRKMRTACRYGSIIAADSTCGVKDEDCEQDEWMCTRIRNNTHANRDQMIYNHSLQQLLLSTEQNHISNTFRRCLPSCGSSLSLKSQLFCISFFLPIVFSSCKPTPFESRSSWALRLYISLFLLPLVPMLFYSIRFGTHRTFFAVIITQSLHFSIHSPDLQTRCAHFSLRLPLRLRLCIWFIFNFSIRFIFMVRERLPRSKVIFPRDGCFCMFGERACVVPIQRNNAPETRIATLYILLFSYSDVVDFCSKSKEISIRISPKKNKI